MNIGSKNFTYASDTYSDPAISSFDMVIHLTKESFVSNYYNHVSQMLNDFNSSFIRGIKPRNPNDPYFYLFCNKFGILIRYPRPRVYYKSDDKKSRKDKYYFRTEIDVEFLNVNPINLYDDDSQNSLLCGINSDNNTYYDSLYNAESDTKNRNIKFLFDMVFGKETSKYLFDPSGCTINPKYVKIKNIVVSANVLIPDYHRFYIGYNRLIGLTNGRTQCNSKDGNSVWKVEFNDPTKEGPRSKHISVGIYDMKEYFHNHALKKIRRKCGSDAADRYYRSVQNFDSITDIDRTLQIRVCFSDAKYVRDYVSNPGKELLPILNILLGGYLRCNFIIDLYAGSVFGHRNSKIIDLSSNINVCDLKSNNVIIIDINELGQYYSDLYNKKSTRHPTRSIVNTEPILYLLKRSSAFA